MFGVYFLMNYRQERTEHEALAFQIAEASQTLAELPEVPQNLELQLAAVQASLAAEKRAFPSKVNSTEFINTILELADESGVKAIPLVTQSWSTEKISESDYQVFRLNVTVEGSFSQLLSFMSKLERGEYKTLVVENLSITRIPEEESTDEETIPVIASCDLAIYAQSLTSD
ncbi:hypothetical protein ES703_45162 [subsurface metagenome]